VAGCDRSGEQLACDQDHPETLFRSNILRPLRLFPPLDSWHLFAGIENRFFDAAERVALG
jgi:hypothetical protein